MILDTWHRFRRTILNWIVLLYFFETLSAAETPSSITPTPCERFNEAAQIAARIRQLPAKESLRCRSVGKSEYETLSQNLLKDSLQPQELEYEDQIYRRLGVIPKEYSYSQCALQGFSREGAAFYWIKHKEIILPDWVQLPTEFLVHEATHALQDQYYDLQELLNSHRESDDTYLAKSALVEGDAMVVERLFLSEQTEAATNEHEAASTKSETASSAHCGDLPETLRTLFYFPYDFGTVFIERLRRSGGFTAVNIAYNHPPLTTMSIIHEKLYPSTVQPSLPPLLPTLNDSGNSRRFTLQYQNSLGQYFLRVYLGLGLNPRKAISAAVGWRGDTIALWKSATTTAVTWQILFASVKDAEEALEGFRTTLSTLPPENRQLIRSGPFVRLVAVRS